jgi:plastocyanin
MIGAARASRHATTGCLLTALGLAMGCAMDRAVAATVIVTLNVAATSAGPPEDAVVVLDPVGVATAPARDSVVTIDQVNKQFVPQVSIVRTGTGVSFPNSDQIKHDVYSHYLPKIFELKLYAGRPTAPVVFDQPGLEALGCNVHDKMRAFLGIVDSPYFAKIERLGRTGSVSITVPAGRYSVRVWHPDLAVRVAPQPIEVKTEAAALSFDLDLSGVPDPKAAWPWP